MNRFTKLLGAVALLGISLAACEESTPPPPVGSIVGQVSIEGMGIDGVSVNLSNGNTTTTAGGGSYRFDNVEGGAYTVTISGFPSDATFDATSAAATIASSGQSVTLNFTGAYIRTASVMGSVTVENMGLSGVTVALSGVSGASAVTDDSGQYAFTGLRMGSYSVEISGFDNDEIGFSNTAAAVAVGVGESKIVSFDGTYLRTAGIMGRVSVEGESLEGVTVSLTGGPDATDMTTMTDAAGQYSFAKLRAGAYAVGISGYDMDDYEFENASQNVTVALGQTANVPFEGVLLRTSGISGRVSVEGMGLADITVTLSMADADDMTAMTDAGGLYAFAGLAAGDYTVAIAVEGDAYVFETMSVDVTIGDDETAIRNFEGDHATTASVSGVVFIDEATKNDMMDEGEHPVAHAGLPVALVGPGVSDQMIGATDSTGAFAFTGLKAGTYQLVFSGAAALPADLAFGGEAVGYTIALGVGEAHMQNLPIDITHTTVNFTVHLKSGEMTGDALPGATVNLYADKDGETKVGGGETDEMGMTAIRVERARTSGNMAYAGVMAPDGFGVGGDMQMIEWNPQHTMSAAANSQDIVNLKAEVSFAGQTITTAMGGGKALAGWGIDVTMMGDDGMEAVEGAPEKLDDEGMGSITMMAESADDLPMTYYVTLDADQDNKMDGGENYATVDTVMHTHTGLSADTEMDAGTVTARYTTQTLMVSVYREVDQVPGYTGNIGTADVSTSAGVEIEIRHETPSNRRGTFDPKVWKWDTSGADRTVWQSKGVYTFKGLPADANVFVLADEAADDVEVLYPDNLAAFENAEANGIMGGAFGSEGGFHHTVSLCPHTKVDPTGQDFGECGSFGFVKTYTVAAHVKKNIVKMDDDDAFEMDDDGEEVMAINVEGVELGFTPVTGKNIAGEAEAVATLKKAVRTTGENSAGTDHGDEKQDLNFGRMAEGVYGVSLSSGWAATIGDATIGKEFRIEADVAEVVKNSTEKIDLTAACRVNPKCEFSGGPFGSSAEGAMGVYIKVRPTTGTLYGVVEDEAEDPVEGATVTVNGVTTETDIDGRYIVADYSKMASRASGSGGKLFITVSKDGKKTQTDNPNHATSTRRYQIDGAPNFEANAPQRLDITLVESDLLATISGTVTDKDGDPVSGVDITVTWDNAGTAVDVLQNATAKCTVGTNKCRKTGDDGTYTLTVLVKEDDEDYTITPSKTRYYFDNTDEIERLEAGDAEVGVDFEALRQSRIRGSVRGPDGGMEGVKVTATAQGREDYTPYDETNANGRFTIWVDGDERYDVTAEGKGGYTFAAPEDADGLRVDDDETHEIGVFTAETFGAVNLEAARVADADGVYDGNVNVTFDRGTIPDGHVVSYQAFTKVGDADRAELGSQVTSEGDADLVISGSVPTDSEFTVIVEATSNMGTDDEGNDETVTQEVEVAGIDPVATLTKAGRNADDADQLDLVWTAKTNSSSSQRIVLEVQVTDNRKEWLVASTASGSDRTATLALTGGNWAFVDVPGTTIDVTAAMLAKAFRVAVESVHGEVTDKNQYKRSNDMEVKAKPSS